MPKINLELKYKKQIADKTYYLIYQTDQKIDLTAGQFISLAVQEKVMRPYSIVEIRPKATEFFSDISLPSLENTDTTYLSLMISTKPGGVASQYIENTKVGDRLMTVGPAGRFRLTDSKRNKVYIATGTGLAPFVAMANEAYKTNPETKNTIYFASWNFDSSFADIFVDKYNSLNPQANLKLIKVAEDAQGQANNKDVFEGRVTTVVLENENEALNNDYYLCGHPAMVSAMAEVLTEKGIPAEQIIMEKFA